MLCVMYVKHMNDLNRWILQSLQAMVMIGLAITSVVVVILVVVPQLLQAIQIQGKISEDKDKLNAEATRLATLSDVNRDDLRAKLITILEVLPEEFEVPRIIGTIKGLGVDTALDVKEVQAVVEETPENPTAGSLQAIKKQRASLQVTADIVGMVKFLGELEKVAPILKVAEVKASRNSDGKLDASLLVESYAFSDLKASTNSGELTQAVPKLAAQDDRLFDELKDLRRYDLATASSVTEDGRVDPFQAPGN